MYGSLCALGWVPLPTLSQKVVNKQRAVGLSMYYLQIRLPGILVYYYGGYNAYMIMIRMDVFTTSILPCECDIDWFWWDYH